MLYWSGFRKESERASQKGQRKPAEGYSEVSAESIPLEDLETGKSSRFCSYCKMEVLEKVEGEHTKKFIKKNMSGDCTIYIQKQNL
jgi:hypothetical protein